MSERPIEAYDPDYNLLIPDNWWLSDTFVPTKFAYGAGQYGSGGAIGTNWPTYVMANNAYCIAKYLLAQGWHFESICALFGNIQGEGNFSPGKWENGHMFSPGYGFGLVQWTPSTKYTNWAQEIWGADDPWGPYYYSGWYECYRLAMEGVHNLGTQWLSTTDFPLTIREFCTGHLIGDRPKDRVQYGASAWMYCYERPASSGSESQRRARALAWFDRFRDLFGYQGGVDPTFTSLKATPQLPGPYFGLDDVAGRASWWYKVLYMASRKGSAFSVYSK